MAANLLYEVYEYRLAHSLPRERMPLHIGVILDGNRRWAKAQAADATEGHRVGASKVLEFLTWAQEVDVKVVTLWMLSTDNMSRDVAEISQLIEIIADTVDGLAAEQKYRINIVGDMSLFPEEFVSRVRASAQKTQDLVGSMQVNVAVGYGGRRELVDAVRSLLQEAADEGRSVQQVASSLTDEDITAHLYTKGQPDPDLIIRTSGEQRLSGFMMWQSTHSEYYFCDTYWPDFRKVDFLRALRSYAQRERRLGK
ncbi:MAG: isoprenyl transferase [Scrofimicrobium sp.]